MDLMADRMQKYHPLTEFSSECSECVRRGNRDAIELAV